MTDSIFKDFAEKTRFNSKLDYFNTFSKDKVNVKKALYFNWIVTAYEKPINRPDDIARAKYFRAKALVKKINKFYQSKDSGY